MSELGQARGIILIVDVLDNEYAEKEVLSALARRGYQAKRVVDKGPTAAPQEAPIGVVTAKMIIRFDGRTGSTHMTNREHWGELMAEQINAAQPPTVAATAQLREHANQIIHRIVSHAVLLIQSRSGLVTELEHDDISDELANEIVKDIADCLTGEDSGCIDPEELDAENCDGIWLTEILAALAQADRSK